jgi:hypothetical protein
VLSLALRLGLRGLRLAVAGVPSAPSHGDHTRLLPLPPILPSFSQALVLVYSFIKAIGHLLSKKKNLGTGFGVRVGW